MMQLIHILITWCLVGVISCNLISIYIAKLIPIRDSMERVITVSCYYVLIHALHVLIAITFFASTPYVNWAAPYGLGYGPLLYFALRTSKRQTFTWWIITLHLLPFMLFFIIYLAGLWKLAEKGPIYLFLRSDMYPIILSSFIGYGLYAISQSRKLDIPAASSKLLSRATFLALLTGFLFIAIILNHNSIASSYLMPRLFLYILLLTISMVLLHHKIIHLSHPQPTLPTTPNEIDLQKPHYHKSLLPKATLIAYQERLEHLIQHEKLFLDATLNIDKLSQSLGIPKHHLSQVFNVHIGKNFSAYINEARIHYACHLLSTQPSIVMEQLAYQSGFNSKVSFYRHFKQQIGCTPMLYLKRIRRL